MLKVAYWLLIGNKSVIFANNRKIKVLYCGKE